MAPSISAPGAPERPNYDGGFGLFARAARRLVVLTVAEGVAVFAYLAVTGAGVVSARYLVYPFVWINAAALVVAYAPIPRPNGRRTAGAVAAAAGYFLLLCWAGGLVSAGDGTGVGTIGIHAAAPGWGPIVSVSGGAIHASLVPFKIAGYVSLAALVYAALAKMSRGAVSGVLGLVTCVSCTGSVLATILAGAVGGSSVAVAAAVTRSYDLSTAVFLLAVSALWFEAKK